MSNSNNKQKLFITMISVGVSYVAVTLIGRHNKKANAMDIDKDNPYLEGECKENESYDEFIHVPTEYENVIKPKLDKILSFCGLIALSPLYAILSLAIVVDDPGPVLFTQKRVGRDKHFFKLHKFRTMKMSTPHDVPTHQLENPDQYITRIGRLLRKYSLDELPQIWDIFIGNMSIIGPRPALWNQDDLVAERDRYDANSVLPGLTGWAQINGRDELEITDKARLDGDYIKTIDKNSWQGFLMDIKCFINTIKSVSKATGVVEGGTGEFHRDEISAINEEKIKVSVITPAFNAGAYLEDTIVSVLNQSYSNWEMIIVDDCSTDDTVSIASKYVEKDSRIRLIKHANNKGVAAARNTALDIATGLYVAFLDSDDQWTPQKLEHQLRFMETNHYVLTYTDYQIFDTETHNLGKLIKVPKKLAVKDIYKNTAIACLTVMVNRNAVGEFHMPGINHFEDQATWQEILKRGDNNRNRIAYGLNENMALYRVGNASLTSNRKRAANAQWHTYRDYYKFSVARSVYYFICYSINAVMKHFF